MHASCGGTGEKWVLAKFLRAAPLSAGRASPIAAGSLLPHQTHRVRQLDDAASALALAVAVARAAVRVRGGGGVSTW